MMREIIFELDAALYNDKTGEAVFKPKVIGEIIRCKDCVHKKTDGYCEVLGDMFAHWEDWTPVHDDFFCAKGARQ